MSRNNIYLKWIDFCKRAYRRVFRALSVHQKAGLTLAVKFLVRERTMTAKLFVTSFVAALFESGTIAILGYAIAVLVGSEFNQTLGDFGTLHTAQESVLSRIGTGGLFLILVNVAIAAQVLKCVLLYLSDVTQIIVRTDMRLYLEKVAIARIMKLSYKSVSSYPGGRISGLVAQFSSLTNILDLSANGVRAVLMLAAYIGLMWIVSAKAMILVLLAIYLLWMSLKKVVQKIKILSKEATLGSLDTARWLFEYLNQPKLIRIFGLAGVAEKALLEARERAILPAKKANIIKAGIKPVLEIISVVGVALVLVLGYVVTGDSATEVVPQLFIYVVLFHRLRPHVATLNDVRIQFARTLPIMDLVGEFLGSQHIAVPRKRGRMFKNLRQSIQMSDVRFSYNESDSLVLDHVNLEIPVGKTIALIGPSGAGKSTILDLIMNLYEPSTGKILIDGTDVGGIDVESWRGSIGMVDQAVSLFNTTIRENILLSRSWLTEDDLLLAAQTAHAHDFILKTEKGYETVIGDRGFKLSGGQRQRVAMARALVGNPKILLFDEATSALDHESENEIQAAIDGLRGEKTIVLVAHRLSTVVNADQIVLLEAGQVTEIGSFSELMNYESSFRKLWYSQFKNNK